MAKPIPYSVPFFPSRTSVDLAETFESTYVSGFGEAINKFESLLEAEIGADCLLVSNGSAALRLAFLTLGLNSRTKVILPAWGFHVAANIAYSFGAQLEFVDVEDEGWCLDAKKLIDIEMSENTIIVLIHTLGNCSDLNFIQSNYQNVRIIEDAAEALFSKYNDKQLGTLFDAGTYSFHAAKTITTGEGGMTTFKSKENFQKAKLFRSHGMTSDKPYFHQVAGDNLRISNLLAAIGIGQMEQLEFICQRRNAVYERYLHNLSELPARCFLKPIDSANFFPWGFALRITKDFNVSRDGVAAALRLLGVETRPGFSSASQLPYVTEFTTKEFPVSDALSNEVLLLPHYPGLDLEDVDRICAEIIKVLL